MSMPQFPDPMGRRELVNPGATAHKAGLSLEDRVKALEQGALGRPGPGVDDGSVPVADTSSTGNTRWSKAGTIAFDFSKSSGDITISALTTTLKSFDVAGDGTHALHVQWYYLLLGSATNSRGGRLFFDGAQVQDGLLNTAAGTLCSQGWVHIPPWTGTKAVLLQHRAQDSAGTVYSATANPITFKATWVPTVTRTTS